MMHCKFLPMLVLVFVQTIVTGEPVSNGLQETFCSDEIPDTLIPPMITFISPSTVAAGGSDFTLTVNGTDFVATSVVQWNGSNRFTTVLSTTQLTAQISAQDVASGGSATITVLNPFADGGISNGVTFTVNNPVPTVFAVSPRSAKAGSPSFSLVVTGANFVRSSTIQWNGTDRPTGFVDSTRLTTSISASDVSAAGPASVSVVNPGPGGGTSATVSFAVSERDNPVPSIYSITPAAATAGAGWVSLTVNGSGFTKSSTIQWNGTNRNTNFLSEMQLTAAIYPTDTASAGAAVITVFTPPPGGGTSNSQQFTVRPLATMPSATAIATPTAIKAGAAVLLTVKVVPGANPTSTGLMVSADLTSFGGSPTQQLYDDGTHGDVKPGDNIFSFRATVAAGTSNGKKNLPVTVVDAQGRKTTLSIQLTVGSTPGPVGR